MSAAANRDDPTQRLQALLVALESTRDDQARQAARQLVQAVLELHGAALADMLALVREAGTQPADTLLPRFASNPRVAALLLLHDLHPQDLETRARKAIERLRPHLGVKGVRADLAGVEDQVVRISVTVESQKKARRPSAFALRGEIENAVLKMVPDATQVIIAGLEATVGSAPAYVPLSSNRSKPHFGGPRGAAARDSS